MFNIRGPALGESWKIVWPADPGYYVITSASEGLQVTANLRKQSGQFGQI